MNQTNLNDDLYSSRYIRGMTLNVWSSMIHDWATRKGFWKNYQHKSGNTLAVLMLVVTELAEAAEHFRNADLTESEANGRVAEELCDAIVRILDLLGSMAWDVEGQFIQIMLDNEKRPHLHGKKC